MGESIVTRGNSFDCLREADPPTTDETRARDTMPGDRALKDSGDRRVMASGAQRDRGGNKGRYDLLQWVALRRIAQILEKGATKYDARNWEKGMPLGVYVDSAARHLGKFIEGWTDEDHLGQAAWNLLSAMHTEEMIQRGVLPAELDDMPHYYDLYETKPETE